MHTGNFRLIVISDDSIWFKMEFFSDFEKYFLFVLSIVCIDPPAIKMSSGIGRFKTVL